MMLSESLGQGQLPGEPVYGVPPQRFRQTLESRQMQSPPQLLEQRPPTAAKAEAAMAAIKAKVSFMMKV